MTDSLLKKLGLKVGHYTDEINLTGLTVFIAEEGANIGVDVRGSNSGTINTAAFSPTSANDSAHAIVLTGGSLFGLESSFGIIQYLEEKRIGFYTPAGVVPGITGAVIYDLVVGSAKIRPTHADGYNAAQSASFDDPEQGNVGVGTGATAGKWLAGKKMKGGFGYGVSHLEKGIIVAAFVVTNSVGDIVNPKTGEFYSDAGQFELVNDTLSTDFELKRLYGLISKQPLNTTLAVVATNIMLSKVQLIKVAELSHNGMARAIHPIHTTLDGDTVFALSSHSSEQKTLKHLSDISIVDLIGLAAANAMTKAIKNSILHATSIDQFPCYKDIYKENY